MGSKKNTKFDKKAIVTGKTEENKITDKKLQMTMMQIQKILIEFIKIRKSRYNKRAEEEVGISGNIYFRHWKHCQFKSKNMEINI